MVTIGLKTGMAWAMEIEVEGDEHSDLIQLLDDYYEENGTFPVCMFSHEDMCTLAEETGESVDELIEQYIPINGGEWYIEGIEYVKVD